MENENIITVKTKDCTFHLNRKFLPFTSEKEGRTYLTNRIAKYTKHEKQANVDIIIDSVISELYPKRTSKRAVEVPPIDAAEANEPNNN